MGITPLGSADPEQIAGYRLRGRLGSGGQGVVYQGHSDDAGLVAVKALHATWLTDVNARSRLAKEVAAARRVAPFCTARVLEADLDIEQPYIVSEFIPGPSLAEHVLTDGPLSGTSLDRLAVGTMTALLAIHEAGLVHRDVKPANVILGPDGPRVVDFGIARDLNGHLSGTTGMIGTPMFMAPEQVNGQPLTPAADVFSWAVLMVFAATGRSPFEAEHVTAVLYRVVSAPVDLSGVPPRLAAVLESCLAKDPAVRPTARQVLLHLIGSPTAGLPAGQATWAYGNPAEDGTQALLARAATIVGSPAPPTMIGTAGSATFNGSPDGSATVMPQGSRRALRDQRGRGPSLALAVVGGVALLAAVGLVIWDRTLGAPAPGSGPIVIGGGQTIPETFAGSWQGGVAANDRNWVMQLRLTQGATIGDMSLLDNNNNECRYVLTLTEIDEKAPALTFAAIPTSGPAADCGDPNYLTLTKPTPPAGTHSATANSDPAHVPFQVHEVSIVDGKKTSDGSVARVG